VSTLIKSIQSTCFQFPPFGRSVLDINILVLAYLHVVTSHPFIFAEFIPFVIRHGISGLLICSLFAQVMLRKMISHRTIVLLAVVPLLLIVGSVIRGEFTANLSLISNTLICIGLYEVLSMSDNLARLFIATWRYVLGVLALLSILAFFFYNVVGSGFEYWLFSKYRAYLHNDLLGNLTISYFRGQPLGRVSGWMYEGVYLGFFMSLGLVSSRGHRQRAFFWLFVLGGLATLSTTFLLVICIYPMFLLVEKDRRFIILVGVILTLLIWWGSTAGILAHTSYGDRTSRMMQYFSTMGNYSISEWLWGVSGQTLIKKMGIGFDPSWVAILMKYGVFVFMGFCYLIWSIAKRNIALAILLLFYALVIDYSLKPLFYLSAVVIALLSTMKPHFIDAKNYSLS
jgi:hypothetical protein